MRLVREWDALLVSQLQLCSPPERAILTTYPAGYELPEGGTQHWRDARLDESPAGPPFLVFSGFGEADGMMRFKVLCVCVLLQHKLHISAASRVADCEVCPKSPCVVGSGCLGSPSRAAAY
jgi:hypothetical protein